MAAARSTTEDTERWRHLERAHILSQPYPWPHTRNHIAMRALALRPHDRREALGQVVRIIGAAPGPLSPATQMATPAAPAPGLMTPMPIPPTSPKPSPYRRDQPVRFSKTPIGQAHVHTRSPAYRWM
ncbi:DUF3703 domain-containing protein [Rhodococcus koreensis]